jgi:hypothetical protein
MPVWAGLTGTDLKQVQDAYSDGVLAVLRHAWNPLHDTPANRR